MQKDFGYSNRATEQALFKIGSYLARIMFPNHRLVIKIFIGWMSSKFSHIKLLFYERDEFLKQIFCIFTEYFGS